MVWPLGGLWLLGLTDVVSRCALRSLVSPGFSGEAFASFPSLGTYPPAPERPAPGTFEKCPMVGGFTQLWRQVSSHFSRFTNYSHIAMK